MQPQPRTTRSSSEGGSQCPSLCRVCLGERDSDKRPGPRITPHLNAYALRLALPRRMRCSPTVNVDRLKPFFERAGGLPAPGPVSDMGQEGEHEVELRVLNRRTTRGVTRYLVRWRGHASSDDEWLRVEELSHCPEKVAEYDAAAPRRRTTRRAAANQPAAPPARAAGLPSSLVAPTGFRLAAPAEVLSGPALVGRAVRLFRWPTEGWVRGTVARRSRAAGFSHVVRYGPRSALGAAVVDSLLDAASHGPAGAALPGPPRPAAAATPGVALAGRPSWASGPGGAGRTESELAQWNQRTRLMHLPVAQRLNRA